MGTTVNGALATVCRFYELVPAGRIAEVGGLCADDFVVREPPGLPYGGDFHGVTGFGDIMGQMAGLFEFGVVGAPDYREAGDRVLVHLVGRFTARATGRSAETDIVEVFTVHEGRIAEIDVYYKDPAAIAALAA